MNFTKLLVLLLVNLNQFSSHAAQEPLVQDEPFVIVPFEQLVESTIKNFPGINQTFTFLQEKHLVNQSFRQFLQTELASDEDENDKRGANFDEVLDQAHEIIAANMKDQFIETLNTALNKNKTLDQFHNPIILYVMQHKDDSMRDMVHHWLYEWSTTEDDDGCVPLHRAALKNNLEIAHLLIVAGANLNVKNNNGFAPLHIVAKEIAHLLITAGANLNIKEIVHLLITAGADINIKDNHDNTPLHTAIIDHRQEVACLLIDAGADVDIQNNGSWTSLYQICTQRNHKIFFITPIRSNINLQDRNDCKDYTPLHLAIVYEIKIAHLLIAKDANINLQDRNGRTPLHEATAYNQSEVARLLIAKGANLNLQDNYSDTPLHEAITDHELDIACLLIGAGADINIQNKHGQTPLHLASISKKMLTIARLLISAGADISLQNNDRLTAEQIAKTPEMRTLFVQARQDKKNVRDMAIFENQIKKDWR